MRSFGLDVHRDFCEVAICEHGRVRSAGRVPTSPETLQLFADSLAPTDQVALEATGNALADRPAARAARRPRRGGQHQGSQGDHRGAREDRPPRRPHAGEAARRRPAHEALGARRGHARAAPSTRPARPARAPAHALQERDPRRALAQPQGPPAGQRPVRPQGRQWLGEQTLPDDERETVDGCLRQIDFLDTELADFERAIARLRPALEDIRRLLTCPASTWSAPPPSWPSSTISGASTARASSSATWASTRCVRQSGAGPARHGRISKEGASEPPHAHRAAYAAVPPPARCAPSISACAAAAAAQSPSSPSRASSP